MFFRFFKNSFDDIIVMPNYRTTSESARIVCLNNWAKSRKAAPYSNGEISFRVMTNNKYLTAYYCMFVCNPEVKINPCSG